MQSAWDQCLFFKWVSPLCFIYVLFHVDDFITMSTSNAIIDEFEVHLKSKYEVTSNSDGLFLGIEILRHGSNAFIYRKPVQLQTIFDKYLPNGPTIPPPKGPMRDNYHKNFSGWSSSVLYWFQGFTTCD